MTTQQPPSFGALLRHYRDLAGLTQEELARRASLSVPTVSNLERGRSQTPYRATVRSLAGALELSGGGFWPPPSEPRQGLRGATARPREPVVRWSKEAF